MKTVLQICYQGGQHKKVLEVSFSHFPVNVFIDTALQSMRSVNKIRDTGHKFLLLNEKQHNFKRQGLSTTDPCPRATVTPCKDNLEQCRHHSCKYCELTVKFKSCL